jgi:3-deoxy-7-phosphoheptulonate synthase
MILHIKKNAPLQLLLDFYKAAYFEVEETYVLITSSSVKEIDNAHKEYVDYNKTFDSDIQLASKDYITKRSIQIGDILIGGQSNNTLMITGPCSVESMEQIETSAQFLVKNNVKVLRAGCFKPRTSPYTFQGLGSKGLDMLVQMREKYGLKIITEAKDATHIDEVIEKSDIVQIGAKAMYDHGILKACSKTQKPVLIKRGFGSTLQEFVQSAEFVLSGGNPNVMLCERGIRTFENKTRFTLDLCGVSYLKEFTNLPIILDPSHAMGYRYGVADLARACVAMGIDGLLIESHPNPKVAQSDASQQLDFEQFEALQKSLIPIAEAVGMQMI